VEQDREFGLPGPHGHAETHPGKCLGHKEGFEAMSPLCQGERKSLRTGVKQSLCDGGK